MQNSNNLTLSPIGLLKILNAFRGYPSIMGTETNPLIASVGSVEVGDRFAPKLVTNMASGVKEGVTPPQSSAYQTNPLEALLTMIFQQIPLFQRQGEALPQTLEAAANPVLEKFQQQLAQGIISDITSSLLKQKLDEIKQTLQTIPTTEAVSASVSKAQPVTPQQQNLTPTTTPTSAIPTSSLQQALSNTGASFLKNLQSTLMMSNKLPQK